MSVMKEFVVKHSGKDNALMEAPSSPVEDDTNSGLTYLEYFQNSQSEDERNLVLNLCELFNEIDFTGEKYISWDDFMSYLLDAVSDQSARDDQIKEYGSAFSSPGFEIDDPIKKVCYFEGWDKVVTCGKTKRCRIYEAKDLSVVASLPDHEGAILHAEYLSNHNTLVTSSADLCVRFWNASRFEFDLEYMEQLDATQTVLKYSQRKNLLFSASRTGDITYWHYGLPPNDYRRKSHLEKAVNVGSTSKYQKQVLPQNKDVFYQARRVNVHNDVITDMILLPHDDKIITSSLDSTIRIFDVEKEVKIKEFLGHNKGVTSIAWANEYHFLISAGSEREPLIWIANVEHRSPFRLRDQRAPHQHSLVGVWAVPETPQVISADTRGLVKIWDVRTHRCVQTILTDHNHKTENQGNGLSSFTYIPSRKQLVTAGKTIKVYEYDRTEKPKGADDCPILSALYNPSNFHFMTTSSKGVKLWDALSGACSKTYNSLTVGDLTAACLDDRGRKFIIGNHLGQILAFNFSNASPSKSIQAFDCEISSLIYLDDGSKCMLATSSEGEVAVIYDKTHFEKRNFKLTHKSEVKCSAFSRTYSLAVTGDISSNIYIWDVKNLTKLADVRGHGEVTSLCFLGVLPAFVAAESSGRLVLYTTRPFYVPFIPLLHWFNEPGVVKTQSSPEKSAGSNSFITEHPKSPSVVSSYVQSNNFEIMDTMDSARAEIQHRPYVTAIEYDLTSGRLITGDEKGFLCIYDLESLIEVTQLRPTSKLNKSQRLTLNEMARLQPTLIYQWKGHNEAVTSIQIIREPSTIVSSSRDSTTMIWTMEGELMDSLRQETKEWNDVEFENIMSDISVKNPKPFNFPINVEERRKEDALTVSGVIAKITKQLRLIGLWKATNRETRAPQKDVDSLLTNLEKAQNSRLRSLSTSPSPQPEQNEPTEEVKKYEHDIYQNRVSNTVYFRSGSVSRSPSPSSLNPTSSSNFGFRRKVQRESSKTTMSMSHDGRFPQNGLIERRPITVSRKKPILSLSIGTAPSTFHTNNKSQAQNK